MSSQWPFSIIPIKLLPATAPRRPSIKIIQVAIALIFVGKIAMDIALMIPPHRPQLKKIIKQIAIT